MDTYAVCASCNRLSSDLHVCDKCGTALSDDNAAHCYSSLPKRSCVETRASETAVTQCNGVTSNTTSVAISASTSPLTSSDNSVRPQALYVNVNNQAFPVIGVATTTASPAGSTRVNSSVSNPTVTAASVTSQTAVPATRSLLVSSQPSSQPRPMTQITLPTHNQVSSNVARLPIQSKSIPHPAQSAFTMASAMSSYVFQVTSVQIRLGSKKFKPLTAVTFKDDGVLFTLTGMLVKVSYFDHFMSYNMCDMQ